MRNGRGFAGLRTFTIASLAGLIGAFVVCGVAAAETAATPDAAAAQPKMESTPAVAPSDAPALELTGFRSALFGMSETEVRAAIAKDFGATINVKASQNQVEHTRVLVIKAPDVLPEGGMAEISYVFGYKTKTLIQIGVLWSKTTDETMKPERLVANAETLRAYFATAGYKPDSVVQNRPTPNGVLMFRGSDAAGRTTVLLLQGVAAEKPPRALSPTALTLFYLASVTKQDVYRVRPGSF